MVDLDVLAKYGVTAEAWKEKFAKPKEDRSEKHRNLVDLIRSRIQAGRDFNIERYHIHHAMDKAWDAAYQQITPTMVSTLRDQDMQNKDDLMKILKGWGLDPNEVLVNVPDPKTPGTNTVKVSHPAFIRIMVPLCAAYVKIRWAKLTNDRKMLPLFKFDPIISTEFTRLQCDVLTGRVSMLSTDYAHFETMKQAIFRMLHYSECVQFPVESWHTECSIVEANAPIEGVEEVTFPDGTKGKKIITREGIRYHLPHPTRTYYDRAFWPSTLNTDTGCGYAGYWRIVTFREIHQNKNFFNLEQIGFKHFAEWFNGRKHHSYWVNAHSGCSLNFPDPVTSEAAGGKYDTEKHVANWYSTEQMDRPICITEHFEKLIPKEWDLGDYPEPIWVKFTMAADDDVIGIEIPGYRPTTWWGYDYVEGRTSNVSMTLETLPFQDQFTNLLTQLLLTTRQNLANITFVDSDMLDEPDLKKIENWGEMWYRGINLVRASFSKFIKKQQSDPARAVVSHKFPMGDTQSIINSMKIILDTLERILVMSAQEVGQSASHEQTREEVRTISQNTNIRVDFTALGVDFARDAWKRQLYEALMTHGRSSVWVQVPSEQPLDAEKIKKLGFTASEGYDDKSHKQQVLYPANSTALKYVQFASDRDGQDRVNDMATGTAMLAILEKVLANQMLAPAIGVDQAIQILNQCVRFLGFPRDFRLVNTGQTQTIVDQIMEAMKELKQYIDGALEEEQKDDLDALKKITLKNQEQDIRMMEIVARLNQLLSEANKIQTPQLPGPTELDMISAAEPEMAAGMM